MKEENIEVTNDWFSGWFDSEYYHLLYKNRDYQEAERFLTNLMRYLKLDSSSKILDLACGKGRHSIFLNGLGYDVTGVDLSANSIESASKQSSEKLRFGTHDMRLPFDFGSFDAILNVFTSFGYFNNPEEDLQTLYNVSNALTEDGIFVMDFMNVDFVEAHLVAQEVKTVENVEFHLSRKIENGSIIKDILFSAENKNYKFQERVDALRYKDFVSYFNKIGFTILDTFGDYDLNAFDIETSKRLILVAKKK